jgi:Fe2+ transport system protein FeoA
MKQRAGIYDLFDGKNYQEVDAVMRPGMPLTMAGTGEKVRILMFASGRGMRQRLASMGLDVGSEIEVIRRAEMAHKIMVIPVERKI